MAERTADKEWERVQMKTFTKWLIPKYQKAGYTAINDIVNDWQSGVKLAELVNALYQIPMPKKLAKDPKMRPQKLDNIEQALHMLTNEAHVKTNFLKPTHLVDSDKTMLLGMIWSIILDYQIKGISVEEMSAKEGLLLWCKRKTAGYKDVNVTNFTSSWTDGLAFCALIHRHRPDLLDFDKLSKGNAKENLTLAFDVAEKELGIPRLLDVEDLLDVARPDERSIVTYVSEYFHKFSAQNQIEVAGKRIANLVAIAKANDQLKQDFQSKAKQLVDWIIQQTAAEQDRNYDNTLTGIEGKWDEHKGYLKDVKPAKTREKLDVETALNQLQAKLRINNRPAYNPPQELSPEHIENLWQTLGSEESARDEWIRKEWERQSLLEQLFSRFWRKAAAILGWGTESEKSLRSDEMGDSVAAVQAKLKNHESFEENYKQSQARLETTRQIGQELISQKHGKSDQVQAKLDELDAMMARTKQLSDTRRAALEKELARQQELDKMRLSFATRARSFLTWIEDAEVGELAEPARTNSLENLSKIDAHFKAFQQESATKASEFGSLQQFAQEMSAAGIHDNPFSNFTIEQLGERWSNLQREVQARASALTAERQRLEENDSLCKQFAQKAQSLNDLFTKLATDLEASIAGDLQAQLAAVKQKEANISSQQSAISELESLDAQIVSRNISYNPHSKLTVNSVHLQFENLVERGEKRRNLIEKEILNQQGSGVSEEQVAEFRETFNAFDKNGNGVLDKHEFKACLSALGYDMNDSAIDQLVASIGKKHPGQIVFEEYVKFCQDRADNSDSATTVKNAFKAIAGDKDHVTADDLKKVPGLSQDVIQYLSSHMTNGVLKYDDFINAQYGESKSE